jgi:hypothetical protein
MAARRIQHGEEPDPEENASMALELWSRCEAALFESRITVVSADRDGVYTWAFNLPAELADGIVGKSDTEIMPADPAGVLASAREQVMATGGSSEIELELTGARGTRWYDVRVRAHRVQARSSERLLPWLMSLTARFRKST